MKVSIITACFNSKNTIKATLDSVLSQNYHSIEHIIMDNISDDGTIEIINSYKIPYEKKGFDLIINSKKDNGIYDAMNEGLKLCKGDVVGFLNSDDFFASNNVVELIVWGFIKPSNNVINIIYADVEYINNDEEVIRKVEGKIINKKSFKYGFHPAHPSFYARKSIYEKYGYFNTKYTISADYEIMLRFLYKYRLNSLYIHDCFVKMRLGGVSNANIKNIFLANMQCMQSWRDNNLSKFPIFIIFKILNKIMQTNLIKFFNLLLRGGQEENEISLSYFKIILNIYSIFYILYYYKTYYKSLFYKIQNHGLHP